MGAALLQRRQSTWKPVAFEYTESRYTLIEKGALAATWAVDKFSSYVLGMKFVLEMDHKS